MLFSCIHTHTILCDGHDDIETNCQMAYKKGLVSLGFSAHAPIKRKTGLSSSWNLPDDRLEEYIKSVNAAKKRWEGLLPVYLGLEVDFISGLMGPADKDYLELGLDFIIAAVHFVIPPRGEPFTVDDKLENVLKGIKEGYGGDPAGMVEAYWDASKAMIKTGGFDVLAHPDVIKKSNGNNRFFSENDDYYLKTTSELASLLGKSGLSAEINTGGMNRGRITDCYPSHNFLRSFCENKVPMVINADAHKAEDLDGHYSEACKAMLAAGYTETVIFDGRLDGKAVWKRQKLPV